jgi:hypothetical protein
MPEGVSHHHECGNDRRPFEVEGLGWHSNLSFISGSGDWGVLRSRLHAGESTMDKVIHDENLKLFHKRLTETTEERQRQVLHNLIAEHEATYREWQLTSQLK